MRDGNACDGSALFFALYDTVENNQTTKLWCESGTIYTPDEKVFDAIQLVFDAIGVGDHLVTGYYDDDVRDLVECPEYLSVAKHYYIDME